MGLRSIKRYYHGTSSALRPGDVLVPGEQRGVNNFDGANNTVVWLHDNPVAAGRYGQAVYEVAPQDWIENFSEGAGHIEEGLPEAEWEYITPRAVVLGSPKEWLDLAGE